MRTEAEKLYQKEWMREYRKKDSARLREQARIAERKYREKNRDLLNEKRRAYVKAHPERNKETRKRWYQRNREKVLAWQKAHPKHLKYKYGMTVEQRDIEIAKQEGKCKICKKPLTQPHVDHDHKTEKFRGILCPRCNHMLGHAKDNPEILERGAAYLRNF
jgi:DNA-directed RNA polymerase subunit RPC12/RpoP